MTTSKANANPTPDRTRRSLLGALGVAAMAAVAPTAKAQASTASTTSTQDDVTGGIEARGEAVKAALRDAKGTKLVLLGTGAGPIVGMPRRQTGHVLVHDGVAYIVDFGLGVTDGFARTGLTFDQIKAGFITHHHPDHNIEYGPFLLLGWIYGLKPSFHAYGPPPLDQMTQDYVRSQQSTIGFWAEDFHSAPLKNVDVTEISTSGFVMADENVRVSCTLVEHPPVNPAFGYRFDFKDRSIAFSGDTVPLKAVADMAKGADVLVHEAMSLPATEKMARQLAQSNPQTTYERMMHHMLADHSPVEAVGRIAQEAGVKTLVLSHLTPVLPETPVEEWRAAAARHFKGEIIVGHDMMVV
jgi:ribonuclease BN (tRNA processing enzyme)